MIKSRCSFLGAFEKNGIYTHTFSLPASTMYEVCAKYLHDPSTVFVVGDLSPQHGGHLAQCFVVILITEQ